MNETDLRADLSVESLVSEVTDEFMDRMARGEQPSIDEYTGRYPRIANVLRQLLPALQILRTPAESEDPSATEQPALGTLGDYRILREVGRGGMGVVYEALQISLGRRVALKVLPFAATLDPKQLQRFKNEAQAAAQLHHQHIVPVYGIGCERGVHFYAMQFIDGQNLAALIQELQTNTPSGGRQPPEAATFKVPTLRGLTSPAQGADAARSEIPETIAAATLSTERSNRNPAFFRTVARLGQQAAQALEHAHGLGIIHRDIKPANLLVDTRGNLWITDFGLAHCQSQAGLTMTGDLVGTLRYMSPEQALAQRVIVDQRTDVYSLGATLYELLTQQPAFAGQDRQELLRQIAFEEPKRPRLINKAIPAELETIVLKSLEKNPAERYSTAQDLADDLERFLNDQVIKARRPTMVTRVNRWFRRHRSLVWTVAVCFLVAAAALGASVGWIVRDRQARQAATELEVVETLDQANDALAQRKWPEALAAVERARGLLAGGEADPELSQRVEQLRTDLEMVSRLEEIHLLGAAGINNPFEFLQVEPQYAQAFRRYGIDLEKLEATEAVNRIRARSIRVELAIALDSWAMWRQRTFLAGEKNGRHLLVIAGLADPDPWRNQLRDALEKKDKEALDKLAASAPLATLPAVTIIRLALALRSTGAAKEAVAFLRRANDKHPGDFWINQELAIGLMELQPPQLNESLRFYTAAIALRPQSPGAFVNLGFALGKKGRDEEAFKAYQRALLLQPNHAVAHNNQAAILARKGLVDEAIAAYRKALQAAPDLAIARTNLGSVLFSKGLVQESLVAHREALRLQPKLPDVHYNLGVTFKSQGKPDEAIASYETALRLQPNHTGALVNLGILQADRGQLDKAIANIRKALHHQPDLVKGHFNLGKALNLKGENKAALVAHREAVRLKPDYAEAHTAIGVSLFGMGQHDEAIATYQEALRHPPELAWTYFNLGIALNAKGKPDDAISAYRNAIRLQPDDAQALNNLGTLLTAKGKTDEAIEVLQKGIQLQPNLPKGHYNLGNLFTSRNRVDEAIAAYREAIRCNPKYAQAHCNLAQMLMKKGQFGDALKSMQRGHDLGSQDPKWPYNSARWVQDCERQVALVARLPAILKGDSKPASPGECLEFAMICFYQDLQGASAQFYADAFAAQPQLVANTKAGHRYWAACAAARAGCGQGKDAGQLDEMKRAQWRQQALEWLRADLALWAKNLKLDTAQARTIVRSALERRQQEAAFAGLRDAAALARLPQAEREQFQQFWGEVAAMYKQAQAK